MELGFLMLTDHSEALNGKVYAMGGGWNMLRFPQLPQEWGFGIAFAIDVPWDQTNRRHTLTLHIEDQRIVLSLGTRTTFSSSGPHAVVVRVGEDEVDRTRFYVLELPEMLTTGTQQQT